jgi:hypothetical protein
MSADPVDLRPQIRLKIRECEEWQFDVRTGPGGQVSAHGVVLEGEHAAAGVLDDDDLGPRCRLAGSLRFLPAWMGV